MRLLLVMMLVLSAFSAAAKEAVPMAQDPVLEVRVRALTEELRCLVCQNQTLAASDSDFANDMRREIRGLMNQGLSDHDVLDFLVQRYGDFILFRPPMKSTTYLLWFGPPALMVSGGIILFAVLRRRTRRQADVPLTADQHKLAESLLAQKDSNGKQNG